jgi:ABC-type polysaccharide/polyol phosphate transport system ATPase subunit
MQTATAPSVIEVENLTKVFHIVHRESSVKSAMLKQLLRRIRPPRDDFVALRDISFTVPRGQTVGLIGRNGSGKSTLLTLMARIYRPSAGRITVRGRVASLLALGAGFNPEFIGLENIFLTGIILGFDREELQRRLPDIIAFAELGEFIDTPIKHYSSGMIARLGFSVAGHVDPDVLLIDEALAVGDLQFQEKCYNKIEEFKQRGVTIFFVSHDMLAVQRVSDRVLWIDDHVLRADGPPAEIIAQYEAAQMAQVPA